MLKIGLYGERCSGTNLLEALLKKNLKCEIAYPYGFKHFPQIKPGTQFLKQNCEIPLVIIIRHPESWVRSLYVNPWHAIDSVRKLSFGEFIRSEWKSHFAEEAYVFKGDSKYGLPIREDMDQETGTYYQNPLKMRIGKYKLMDKICQHSRVAVWIRIEDLARDQKEIFEKLCVALELKTVRKFSTVNSYKGKESLKRRMARFLGIQKIIPNRLPKKPEISEFDLAYIWSQLDQGFENSMGYFSGNETNDSLTARRYMNVL